MQKQYEVKQAKILRQCFVVFFVFFERFDYNFTGMKFVFTKHAIEKFIELEMLGWVITKDKVKRTIKKPRWHGVSRHGQETAMSLVDTKHIVAQVLETIATPDRIV